MRVGDATRAGLEAAEQAVRDLQHGLDRERSFEVLVRCFHPRIERFLARRVFSVEERLDLTQEILLRIYRGLEGYRGEGSLEGWVLQITFNVYRKWRDRQPGGRNALPEVSCDPATLPEPGAGIGTGGTAEAASPLAAAVRREERLALREAIDELPRQQRLCLLLRLYQERSMKEIAVALRISPETVKVHLFQARQRLLARLRGAFEVVEP